MSLINVSLNLVAYADAMKNVNPCVKFTDLKWSMLGLPTNASQMVPIVLSPGASQTVISLSRTLSYSGATSFVITAVPATSYAQIAASFGQRLGRSDGDATTQWAVSITNTLVKVQWTGTGTAPDFTTIQVGDGVTVGAGFSTFNQGDFVIVNKGSNFVEYTNAIGVAETVTAQVDVYSNGPVQVGDIIDISNPAFSFPNQGQFQIVRVTDTFIQFTNSAVVPETVTGVSIGLSVYPTADKWMLLAVDNRVVCQFNGDSGTGCEIEPPVTGDIEKNPGLLLKRGKIFQLTLSNPGLKVANGFVFLSE